MWASLAHVLLVQKIDMMSLIGHGRLKSSLDSAVVIDIANGALKSMEPFADI